MKHILGFHEISEQLSYSGGNVKKMPIIGELVTNELKFGDRAIPETTYKVVEIIENDGKKIYVTNMWYKEGRVPQIIHEDLVKKYRPIKEDI